METIQIPLEKVVQTYDLPNQNKIDLFTKLMEEEGMLYFPPILCRYEKETDTYKIIDGTHRSSAAIKAGYTDILSEIIKD